MKAAGFVVALLGSFCSLSALATPVKAIRDKMAYAKVDNRAKSAIAAVRAACGTTVTVTIDKDSFTKEDSVDRLGYQLDEVPVFAKKYCSDGPSKTEFGRIKSFRFKANPDDNIPDPVVDGAGVMTVMVGVQSAKGVETMEAAMAKFLASAAAK